MSSITRELVFDLGDKIADVKRQLSNPNISGPRKRDLTKYLWRLQREHGHLSGRPYSRG